MIKSDKTIVVTGATGQQGGSAAKHLLDAGWQVRALTRDVSKPASEALVAAGAEVLEAENTDRLSLDRVMEGAYGVFSVQNFWLPGVGYEGELAQGKNVADAAAAAGVQHFVFSSVGAAHRGMGQRHFASKWEIENYLKTLDLPYSILRPVAFMDNYNWQRVRITNGQLSGWGIRPEKGLQLVAVEDIGAFTELVLSNPTDYLGKTIELAGDELTEAQIGETLAKVIGRPVAIMEAEPSPDNPPSEEDLAAFNFFNGAGYDADIVALRKIYPDLLNFEQWLRATGWENAEPMPMPETEGA